MDSLMSACGTPSAISVSETGNPYAVYSTAPNETVSVIFFINEGKTLTFASLDGQTMLITPED